MLNFTKKLFLLYLVFITDPYLHAQTFGFGCLGFVGGYGGYSYQNYKPAGLNDYIEYWNSLEFVHSPIDEFSSADGYRLGLNFFRATFENKIIVTAKGFYQYVNEINKATVGGSTNSDNHSMDLTFKSWALGFDVGWEFTKVVSWKILDGSLNFNSVTFTQTTDLPGESDINKYKSDSGVIGYSIGTGIIVAIIKDYLSIEGLAGYSQIVIDNVYSEDGEPFLNSNYEEKFIDSGGFSAVIQLNVGFPLL
jgi:hypothetical protein